MKKGMREKVSGDDACDCCFGEQLDNTLHHGRNKLHSIR
jgi:hypothetical protein